MKQATYIDPADLKNLVVNEDGTFKIPDNIEIYIKPTIEDQIKEWEAEIAQYEAEKEPTTEDLIELGKQIHPYYMNQERKQELIDRIKEYQIKEVEPVILK